MKTPLAAASIALVATVFAAFSSAGMAAAEHDGHGAMGAGMAMPGEAQWVEGVVKKVDKAAGKVTLAHGPLKNLGMDMAMTMAFRVKDADWLDQMKAGDKIRFVADNVNGVLTMVKFESAK